MPTPQSRSRHRPPLRSMLGALVVVALHSACGCSSDRDRTASDGGGKQQVRDPFLDALAGHWSVVRMDGHPEEPVLLTAEAEWVFGDGFLHLRLRDTREPAEYEASVLLGLDTGESRYVALWSDTLGGECARIGYGKRQGDVVRFRFEYGDEVFFNTFNWDPDTATWRFVRENEWEDGTLEFVMEDRLSSR